MQSAQDIQQHRLGLLPRTTPMLALLKTKSPNRGRMGLLVGAARFTEVDPISRQIPAGFKVEIKLRIYLRK